MISLYLKLLTKNNVNEKFVFIYVVLEINAM